MTIPSAVPPPPEGDPIYVPEPYPPSSYENPYQPGPPAGTGRRRVEPGFGWLLFADGILTAVASLLPWAVFFGTSIDGTNGDGTLTVLCAVIISAVGLIIGFGQGLLWAPITALAVAGLVTITALADIENVTRIAGISPDSFSPDAVTVGPGLWLTLIAGLLGLGVSGLAMLRRRSD